jgi:hypothetical protein
VIPQQSPRERAVGPHRVLAALLAALVILAAQDADAQGRRRRSRRQRKPPAAEPARPEVALPTPAKRGEGPSAQPSTGAPAQKIKGAKDQVFDFTGLSLAGSMRMPQLLYFLDRAEEELARAALERRSFVKEMVRSVDQEAL